MSTLSPDTYRTVAGSAQVMSWSRTYVNRYGKVGEDPNPRVSGQGDRERPHPLCRLRSQKRPVRPGGAGGTPMDLAQVLRESSRMSSRTHCIFLEDSASSGRIFRGFREGGLEGADAQKASLDALVLGSSPITVFDRGVSSILRRSRRHRDTRYPTCRSTTSRRLRTRPFPQGDLRHTVSERVREA